MLRDWTDFILHKKRCGQVVKHFHCYCDQCGVDRGYQPKATIARRCPHCVQNDPQYRARLKRVIKQVRSTPESRAKTKQQVQPYIIRPHHIQQLLLGSNLQLIRGATGSREKSLLLCIRCNKTFYRSYSVLKVTCRCPDCDRGFGYTDIWRKKISDALLGRIPYNKGIPATLEQRIKVSCANRGIKREQFNGFVRGSRQELLRHNLRTRLRQVIKYKKKVGSAVKDLGCTIEQLIIYLENQFIDDMTWDNWGRASKQLKTWHIDHIVPLSAFDLEDREQFKKACHYTNLRPLWAIDNLRKNNKI